MTKLWVVKIGGNIIDDPSQLNDFLRQFVLLDGLKILVHGGGKIASTIGDKLGIVSRYEQGRRITDAATLDLVTMVYGGLINKQMVAAIQALGCNAIGLTGADANLMLADKRLIKEVDYGYVGDIKQSGINALFLHTILLQGMLPVIAPLTHDGEGIMLNTNADTIAQEISKAMAGLMEVQLIYCFDKKGLLANVSDDTSVIDNIDEEIFQQLKQEGVVTGGMIPKIENALSAIRAKVSKVIIGHAADIKQLATGNAGTKIQ
jgi:acetylglutamate kinase